MAEGLDRHSTCVVVDPSPQPQAVGQAVDPGAEPDALDSSLHLDSPALQRHVPRGQQEEGHPRIPWAASEEAQILRGIRDGRYLCATQDATSCASARNAAVRLASSTVMLRRMAMVTRNSTATLKDE